MLPAILILLLIAIVFGVGLAVTKLLLWVAAILFVIWLFGWLVGAGAEAGSGRRWYSW